MLDSFITTGCLDMLSIVSCKCTKCAVCLITSCCMIFSNRLKINVLFNWLDATTGGKQ